MKKPIRHIYDYVDYRIFLRDCYAYCKQHEKGFSHREMASRLGFSSPNFLKLVMDGDRNLGLKSLKKIVARLGLNEQESDYFSHLVFFTQAKDPVEKSYYFGKIAGIRSRRNVRSLRADQFEYFSEWYIPLVRELVVGRTEPLDLDGMSAQVGGSVSGAKIKRAVQLLKRLEMIRLDRTGCYLQTSAVMNTENELDSFAIRQYYAKVLEVAGEALSSVPPAQREFGSLTLRISPDAFRTIKSRIQKLREEFLQLALDDTDPQGVYHLNFQLYPLTTDR